MHLRCFQGGMVLLAAVLSAGCRRPGTPPATGTPQRIVSLTLATDEMLLDLVPVERIIGVTSLVDNPEISNVAGRYPASIPRLRQGDAERIVGMQPDLVCLAPYTSADLRDLLQGAGLPVYRNEAVHSLDEIEAGVRALGERVGAPERAARLAGRMQERRRRLAARLRGMATRPRVLFWSAGSTAGRGSTVDDLIREAGGTNVAAELGLPASAEIASERVMAANPSYLVLSRWAGGDRPNRVDNDPILSQLPAVRAGRVLVLDGKALTSVSPYVLDGVEQLARRLHPKCFPPEAGP